jgi:hypothetical protein
MPTTVTARSVTQEIREAAAPVQAIFSDRESLRGIEGATEMGFQASSKRGRKIKRPTIPAPIANTSAVTSTGNNQGFDPVSAIKAEPIARPGGVFIAISGCGDSCKILPAVLITGESRPSIGPEARAETLKKSRGRRALHSVERSDAYLANTPFGGTSDFGIRRMGSAAGMRK